MVWMNILILTGSSANYAQTFILSIYQSSINSSLKHGLYLSKISAYISETLL